MSLINTVCYLVLPNRKVLTASAIQTNFPHRKPKIPCHFMKNFKTDPGNKKKLNGKFVYKNGG